MAKIKNLRRDIERNDPSPWEDLTTRNVTAGERDEIRQDIRSCIGELEKLLHRLDNLKPKSES